MSKISDWYNDYADRQAEVGINARHKSIHDWMLKFGLQKEHSVLEVGCGIGTQTELLLEYLSPSTKVKAVDISERSIEMAKERCKAHKNVEFATFNIIEEQLNETYDVILLPDVIEHIPLELHPQLFKSLRSLLKETGFIVLHFPQPYYQDWCNVHVPEKMQILDQAVHIDKFVKDSYGAGFYIGHLEMYSIWVQPGEYQIVKLLPIKKENHFEVIVTKQGVVERGINKIKRILK